MRAVAIALLVAFPAAAADVYDAPGPAPASYTALLWRNGGVDSPGYWFTAGQVVKIATEKKGLEAQVSYLTDRAAKECTDATQKANRQWLGSTPTWLLAGGAFVLGVLGGVYAAKRL